jgi:O-antigen ligase
MFREKISLFTIICTLIISCMAAWLIFLPKMQIVPAALIILSFIFVLFVNRIDIAFYITIVLWMSLIAIPLGIASPFGEGGADLPLYELFTPLLGLCLLLRIAVRKEEISNSPLKIPMLVWFGLIILTYFRNPIFLDDLLGESGTGAIYHTLYRLFLCGVFFLCASTLAKTEERIILIAKIVFTVMIIGILQAIITFITGLEIPIFASGPWSIISYTAGGAEVYRIMPFSGYTPMLFLALLCFGTHLKESIQLLTSLLLFLLLALGGGREGFILVFIYMFISLMIARKNKWLVTLLVFLFFGFSCITLFGESLPQKWHRLRIVQISKQTAEMAKEILNGEKRSYGGGRIGMVEMSMKAIEKRPFIGYGYGQLWKHFPDVTQQVAGGNPHSGFLFVMTTHGLVGLGIFLWLFLTSVRTAWILYKNLEDGFLKQLMLWITFHLGGALFTFFVSGQPEKRVFLYFEMGLISSVYAIFVRERYPLCLDSSEQSFLQHTTNSEAITLLSERTV